MFAYFKTERWEMELVFTALCLLTHVVPMLYACDPETQYEKDGDCCKMCGPGFRMSKSNLDCQDPICDPCPTNEYQPAYTKEQRCTVQPYCDPNKNFERASGPSKTSRTPCRCKDGYHCANDECLICLPHSMCGPGEGVVSKGSRTQDTVCKACPQDTFSNESSAQSECVKHTICEKYIQAEGTDTTDTICGHSLLSGEIAALVSGLLILVLIVVVAFLLWKHEAARRTVQGFFMKMCGKTEKEEPENDNAGHLVNLGEPDTKPEPEPDTKPEPEPDTKPEPVPVPEPEPEYTSVPVEDAEEDYDEQDKLITSPTEETGREPFVTHPQSQMNSLA